MPDIRQLFSNQANDLYRFMKLFTQLSYVATGKNEYGEEYNSSRLEIGKIKTLAEYRKPKLEALEKYVTKMERDVDISNAACDTIRETIKQSASIRENLEQTAVDTTREEDARQKCQRQLELILDARGIERWVLDKVERQRVEMLRASSGNTVNPGRFHPKGDKMGLAVHVLVSRLGQADDDHCWAFEQVTDAILSLHDDLDEERRLAAAAKIDAETVLNKLKEEHERELIDKETALTAISTERNNFEKECTRLTTENAGNQETIQAKQTELGKLQTEFEEVTGANEDMGAQLRELTELVNNHGSDDDSQRSDESTRHADEPDPELKTRVTEKLKAARERAERFQSVVDHTESVVEELEAKLSKIELERDINQNVKIGELQGDILALNDEINKARTQQGQADLDREATKTQNRETIKVLLQLHYGDAAPSARDIEAIITNAVPFVRKHDFRIAVDFHGHTKFVDSYIGIELPKAILVQLVLTFLALGGKLKDNSKLHDRRFQLQWLDQVVMPIIHDSVGIERDSETDPGRPSILVPVLAQWLLDCVHQGVGTTRSLALCILFDLLSHFPYKDDEKLRNAMEIVSQRRFPDLDLLDQVITLRFMALALPNHRDIVQTYIGENQMNFLDTMNAYNQVPDLLCQFVQAQSLPPPGFLLSIVEGRKVILLYCIGNEFMFVKGQDDLWSCSTDGPEISYNHNAGALTTARYAGDISFRWRWDNGSALDKYMHMFPTRVADLEDQGMVGDAQLW